VRDFVSGLVRHWPAVLLVVALLSLDQLTKYLISHNMTLGESIPATGFFRFTYVHNTGSAFGLLPGQNTLLTVVSFLGVALLLWMYRTHGVQAKLLRVSLALMLAGAMGNLIDRLTYGKVIDFVDVGRWPIFNVADSSIVTGGLVLAWIMFTTNDSKPKPEGDSEETPAPVLEDTYVSHDQPDSN
jgi:signal peptidase II